MLIHVVNKASNSNVTSFISPAFFQTVSFMMLLEVLEGKGQYFFYHLCFCKILKFPLSVFFFPFTAPSLSTARPSSVCDYPLNVCFSSTATSSSIHYQALFCICAVGCQVLNFPLYFEVIDELCLSESYLIQLCYFSVALS
jgi:hypothetical protein